MERYPPPWPWNVPTRSTRPVVVPPPWTVVVEQAARRPAASAQGTRTRAAVDDRSERALILMAHPPDVGRRPLWFSPAASPGLGPEATHWFTPLDGRHRAGV